MEIRKLRGRADRAAAAQLWAAALTPEWPVLPAGLDLLRQGYVAARDGRCVGLVALAVAADGLSGSIPFIAIDPREQRQGLGTRLMERAVDDLRDRGVTRATAGSGAGPYIWPGVPLDLRRAVAFFDRLGWAEQHVSTDLVRDLRAPGVEQELAALPGPAGMSVGLVAPDARESVLAFEEEHFPDWTHWFRQPGVEMVAAHRDHDGSMAGTLLVEGPGRATMFWPMLGADSATIGCVGVAPEHQNRGIGTAMVAYASEELRRRGAGLCHIGWTERVDFYRRVGYDPWRAYSMRSRTL